MVEREDACYIAKVFRAREHRSFKNDAGYREGRKSRNSRSQRAMDKNSRFGRELAEKEWHSSEVDALTKLNEAGVRVPELFDHYESVLFMELICDEEGEPAPQLGNVPFTPEQAKEVYDQVLSEVIKMLLAGYIHGDLSPYNILMDEDGPVIIDFPQCISAAHNMQAGKILERDIHSISQHLGLIAPEIREQGKDAWQIWQEYENGTLKSDFRPVPGRKGRLPKAEVSSLMDYLKETEREVELSKLAKEGDFEARRELKQADRYNELKARGIEVAEPEAPLEEFDPFAELDEPVVKKSRHRRAKKTEVKSEVKDPEQVLEPIESEAKEALENRPEAQSKTRRGDSALHLAVDFSDEEGSPEKEASTEDDRRSERGVEKKRRRGERKRRRRRRESEESQETDSRSDEDAIQAEADSESVSEEQENGREDRGRRRERRTRRRRSRGDRREEPRQEPEATAESQDVREESEPPVKRRTTRRTETEERQRRRRSERPSREKPRRSETVERREREESADRERPAKTNTKKSVEIPNFGFGSSKPRERAMPRFGGRRSKRQRPRR